MIDEVSRHLEMADKYEENAKRINEADQKAPNWLDTYRQCLKDSKRERILAKRLVNRREMYSAGRDAGGSQAKRKKPFCGDLNSITVGQILRWASIGKSSSMGTVRLRRFALRLQNVAEFLEEGGALGQLLCGPAMLRRLRREGRGRCRRKLPTLERYCSLSAVQVFMAKAGHAGTYAYMKR